MVKSNYNDYIKKVKTYIFTHKKILILNIPNCIDVSNIYSICFQSLRNEETRRDGVLKNIYIPGYWYLQSQNSVHEDVSRYYVLCILETKPSDKKIWMPPKTTP